MERYKRDTTNGSLNESPRTVSIKGITDEDFVNYKLPSMFIAFPNCSFKCDKESGANLCQNSPLRNSPNINISVDEIINRYKNNNITKAIVIGGLEPFDSPRDLFVTIDCFRKSGVNDDIVIYTGYNKNEISDAIFIISYCFKNIIVKFGRFIPNSESKIDQVLGVKLASTNQFAERIS